MLVKFLRHGTGSARRAAAYVLAETDHKGNPRVGVDVLRGDPEAVASVADGLNFTHRYTSGVIAWAPEDDPTDTQIGAVLDDVEQIACAGLDPERVCWTAVRHCDDGGGTHVHVLAARVDLATGRSLNMAPPGWEWIFGQLEDHYNWAHGWARPDDLTRRHLVDPRYAEESVAAAVRDGQGIRKDDLRARFYLWIEQLVEQGAVENRADVLAALGRYGTITRAGKSFISVKPDGAARAIRLKGLPFEDGFDAAAWKAAQSGAGHDAVQSGARMDAVRARDARRKLESAIAKRVDFNVREYGAAGFRKDLEEPGTGGPPGAIPEHEPDGDQDMGGMAGLEGGGPEESTPVRAAASAAPQPGAGGGEGRITEVHRGEEEGRGDGDNRDHAAAGTGAGPDPGSGPAAGRALDEALAGAREADEAFYRAVRRFDAGAEGLERTVATRRGIRDALERGIEQLARAVRRAREMVFGMTDRLARIDPPLLANSVPGEVAAADGSGEAARSRMTATGDGGRKRRMEEPGSAPAPKLNPRGPGR